MKLYLFSSIFFFGISPPVFANPIFDSVSTQPSQSAITISSKFTEKDSEFISSPIYVSELKDEASKQLKNPEKPDARDLPPFLEVNKEKLPTQTRPTQESPSPKSNPAGPNSDSSPPQQDAKDKCFEVKNILFFGKVKGNCTITLKEEIKAIAEKYAGRILSPIEQKNLQDEIALLYIQRGYITSKAEVDLANNTDAQIVKVRIIEGRLTKENIEVQLIEGKLTKENIKGGLRDYVIEQLKPVLERSPLNVNKLEQQLKILKSNRLFSQQNDGIEAFLKPTNNEGESTLTVRIKESDYALNIDANNYTPPSIGAERIKASLYVPVEWIGDLFKGYKDELLLELEFKPTLPNREEKKILDLAGSTFESVRANYRIPLGSTRNFLQLRGEYNLNEIVQEPFDRSNFRAESQLYGISYRHLLESSFQHEFAWSAGFTFQWGQTFVFNTVGFPFGIGPDEKGISQTSIFNLGLDYIHRDGTGRWLLGTRLNWGTGLLNATKNSGSIPDGQFLSVAGQVQRVQNLGARHLLVAQLDFQFASDSLLPSQQFAIGGQQLRGYRQNVRSGDNGFRFSLENNITITWLKNDSSSLVREPGLQIIPFADVGMVWNHPGNPNDLPQPNFLASIGLGVAWRVSRNLELRIDYGYPLVDLSDRGRNLQDKGIQFRFAYTL